LLFFFFFFFFFFTSSMTFIFILPSKSKTHFWPEKWISSRKQKSSSLAKSKAEQRKLISNRPLPRRSISTPTHYQHHARCTSGTRSKDPAAQMIPSPHPSILSPQRLPNDTCGAAVQELIVPVGSENASSRLT
jgi:hypothetical protein